MNKSIRDAFASIAFLGLLATPALAQITNYPGQCTGYSAPGECGKCCARLHPGNTDCTNACRVASPSDAKATMTPKNKSSKSK
jgi:hypothetical protein